MTKAAFTVRAKNLRNELKHGTVKEIAVSINYDSVIARMEYILNGLDYQNMRLFEDLKTRSLEEYTETLVNIVKKDLENEILILKDGLKETTKTANENKQGILVHNSQIQLLQRKTSVLKNKVNEFQAALGDLETTLQQRLQRELDKINESINKLIGEIVMIHEKMDELRGKIEEVEQKMERKNDKMEQNIGKMDDRVRNIENAGKNYALIYYLISVLC